MFRSKVIDGMFEDAIHQVESQYLEDDDLTTDKNNNKNTTNNNICLKLSNPQFKNIQQIILCQV